MISETYLERGRPVVVLAAWRCATAELQDQGIAPLLMLDFAGRPITKGPARNVLIRREDGSLVVRPFRGLRRRKEES